MKQSYYTFTYLDGTTATIPTKDTPLDLTARGRHAYDTVKRLVAERWKSDITAITTDARDTEFAYTLFIVGSVSKQKSGDIRLYVLGILDALKSQ